MLKVIPLESPQDKLTLYKEFDPIQDTWLVSDLRSKFDIQQKILLSLGYFEDESVLRASELWRRLLKRCQPDLNFISRDYLRVKLLNIFKSSQAENLPPDLEKTVERCLDEFSYLYSHSHLQQEIKSWFSENPASHTRWGHWFEFSKRYFDLFLERKQVLGSWAPALLAQQQTDGFFWKRKLFVDLGANVSHPEIELIQKISKMTDVVVLVPRPHWIKKFQTHLAPYEMLDANIYKIPTPNPSTQSPLEVQTRKLSSPLGEVKMCVSQIRNWLESNVGPEQISIFCPDVEEYWPILSKFLEKEGIPVAKPELAKLHSFLPVETWISQCRVAIESVSYGHLETGYYGSETTPSLSFEKFYALFAKMLDYADLKKSETVLGAFQHLPKEKEISRDEFIGWSLSLWKHEEYIHLLEPVLRELLREFAPSEKHYPDEWIFYLEQITGKKEIPIRPPQADGVRILNLSEGDGFISTHRIFLGLSETQMRSSQTQFVSPAEAHQLRQDLGLFIIDTDESSREFDIRWHLQNSTPQTILSFSGTNFDAMAEAPATIWTEYSQNHNSQFYAPNLTRWDQLATHVKAAAEAVFPRTKDVKLSASNLKNFIKCPFIYYVESILGLKSPEFVDLDLDQRRKGILLHKIFELLTKSGTAYRTQTDDELLKHIEQARSEVSDLYFFDESLWEAQKAAYLKKIKAFIDLEEKWESVVGPITPVTAEGRFEFYKEVSGEKIRFSGQVDRVDILNSNELLVTDFKSSSSKTGNGRSLLSKDDFQLFIYCLAIESGALSELKGREVLGAFIYSAKEKERKSGIIFNGEKASALKESDLITRTTIIQPEDWIQLHQEFDQTLAEVVPKIKIGDFRPIPKDKKDCKACQWKNLCRAPHLI